MGLNDTPNHMTDESNSEPSNWLDNLIGSISDASAFLEALEYGRIFRQSDSTDLKAEE
ncbi:MAG: hypothetical protein AAFY54_10895 [Cyanobacteria bacterium J06648_10]